MTTTAAAHNTDLDQNVLRLLPLDTEVRQRFQDFLRGDVPHALRLQHTGDLRGQTGQHERVSGNPITLALFFRRVSVPSQNVISGPSAG